MSVRVRLAPSPTGNLHIGTARTAVFNWLFARNQKGKFILRIEDTDVERSRPEYTDNILEGLSWLGLEWDEGPFYQSQRLELYQKATQDLLDKGLAYRCYCTAAELEEMREAQRARKEAPRYDNRHRNLTAKEQAAFEAEGRQPVIRFKIDDDRIITWNDLVRGKVTWKGSDLGGDMVISRAAGGGKVGQPLYNMAVVVDDMDMEITHVIRGEDHIANTAKQILLYEALEGKVPEFGHTPLILNTEGRKLSKRDGVTSITDFQELGFTPEALANYMCLLGWTPPDATEEIFTLPEAGEKFSFERVNKAGAKFDWQKLDWINSQYLHSLSVEKLTDKLIPIWQKAGYELDPEGDRSWLEELTALIGASLTRLKDAVEMSKLFFSPTVELDEAAASQMQKEDSVKSINSILEVIDADVPLGADDAQQTIKKVTQKVKVKKGIVMRSLRASLTGAMQGPDLIQSWLLLHQKGFDILRFKKSVGEEIEETSKTETTSDRSEGTVVLETTTPKSPALSKEETKTTRSPEQKQVAENKETKVSKLATPTTPTTGAAAKTPAEPKVEKQTQVSTPETTTTDVAGKTTEPTVKEERKISASPSLGTSTTGAAAKTPAEPKIAKESQVSIPETPTTPTTGAAAKTLVEPKIAKESQVSTPATPTTPTTGAAAKTPAEPTVAKESQVSTPTATPTTDVTAQTSEEPKLEKQNQVSTPGTSTTPTTGAVAKTPAEARLEKQSQVSTPETPMTPNTGAVAKAPAEPTVAKESQVATSAATPTTGATGQTPEEPKLEKQSQVSTPETPMTPNTGAAAKAPAEPTVAKESQVATPAATPTTGATGQTPEEPKLEKQSQVSTPATPTTPNTGAAAKTPAEPTVAKESQVATPTATPTTDVTAQTSPEPMVAKESQVATPAATTPTTTGTETIEQKAATQVEASILDDQKPVDKVTNKTIDLEQLNKIKEQLIDIFSNFPDYISQFYQKYQNQLQVVGYVTLAILILTLIVSFLQALQGIPILSVSFELIGMGYTVWFVYRYLLRKPNRQELLDKIENIKAEIVGKQS